MNAAASPLPLLPLALALALLFAWLECGLLAVLALGDPADPAEGGNEVRRSFCC